MSLSIIIGLSVLLVTARGTTLGKFELDRSRQQVSDVESGAVKFRFDTDLNHSALLESTEAAENKALGVVREDNLYQQQRPHTQRRRGSDTCLFPYRFDSYQLLLHPAPFLPGQSRLRSNVAQCEMLFGPGHYSNPDFATVSGTDSRMQSHIHQSAMNDVGGPRIHQPKTQRFENLRLDLNVAKVTSYEELCVFLMKEVNNDEHIALIHSKITRSRRGGKPPKPIKILVDNISTEFNEWSQMYYARSTLERLILVANLYLKLHRIWDVVFKPWSLRAYYSWCRAILSCVTRCCGNDLIEFTTRWGNPFKHFQFNSRCCPVDDRTGRMCGSGVKFRRQDNPVDQMANRGLVKKAKS